MMDSSMLDFMERDVAFLLRKIPTEVQEKHYHSDEVHIREQLSTQGWNLSAAWNWQQLR